MPSTRLEVEGLEELNDRLQRLPDELRRVVQRTTEASLFVLWENVPEYPPPPETSTYIRTGLLGASLGVAMDGSPLGQPDLFTVQGNESGYYTGVFGSQIFYAQDVIGEVQEEPFARYWWNILDVLTRAEEKLKELWTAAMEELARWLAGQR